MQLIMKHQKNDSLAVLLIITEHFNNYELLPSQPENFFVMITSLFLIFRHIQFPVYTMLKNQ